MKRTLQILALILSISILSSCINREISVPEIKIIPVKVGKDYQYIDIDGKIVINPQFSEASIFRNGLALVKTSGDQPKWGFISEDGKFVINANYKSATIFNDDLAWIVTENGPPTAINSKGEIKVTLQDAERVNIFNEGLAAFSVIDSSGEKWGFINKDGKVVINPQFKNVGRFSEGICAVENHEGKWGFIDKQGKIIINYQFNNIGERFIRNKAVVYLDKKAGLIDQKGKFVINPQFSKMMNDGDNYLIEQDNKSGWCDKDGKIIINPQFEEAFPFKGYKLAAVKSGKSWGYIDLEGRIVINPQFDIALPYNGKFALVENSKKFGFIDIEGKYIINPQFDEIPVDLLVYLYSGCSNYETVKSEYFNITSIVNRVNINSPEGLSLSSKLSEVVTKLKISENEFSNYTTQHMVIKNEKITNDASVSFYVIANAFKEIPDGWYTKKVFNLESVVQGYAYVFSLSGKGYGKEKDVKEAIEKTFIGYKLDKTQSTEETSIFKNEKQTIVSYIKSSQIIFAIYNNSNESVQNESNESVQNESNNHVPAH